MNNPYQIPPRAVLAPYKISMWTVWHGDFGRGSEDVFRLFLLIVAVSPKSNISSLSIEDTEKLGRDVE